jgi:hypothetical protein
MSDAKGSQKIVDYLNTECVLSPIIRAKDLLGSARCETNIVLRRNSASGEKKGALSIQQFISDDKEKEAWCVLLILVLCRDTHARV